MTMLLTSAFTGVADKLLPLLKKAPTAIKVAFVPTAADNYEDKWFVEVDRKKLIELGFQISDVSLAGKTYETLSREVEQADIIFVAGGNSFYLLQEVRKSGFDKIVSEALARGVVYVGSSAGSVITCTSIEPIKILDNPDEASKLSSYDGLGLIKSVILPHYGKPKHEEEYQSILRNYKNKYEFILLRDNEAIVVQDGKIEKVS